MDKEINKSTYQYPSTLEELIDDRQNHPEMYKHLQIIFGSKIDHNWGLGQKYLVVNQLGYGIYQLNDLDYRNGKIFLTLTNPNSGKTIEISLDINDTHPKHFLLKWEDIKSMAYNEQTYNSVDEELLELDSD